VKKEETPSAPAVTTTFTAVDISEITVSRTNYKTWKSKYKHEFI